MAFDKIMLCRDTKHIKPLFPRVGFLSSPGRD